MDRVQKALDVFIVGCFVVVLVAMAGAIVSAMSHPAAMARGITGDINDRIQSHIERVAESAGEYGDFVVTAPALRDCSFSYVDNDVFALGYRAFDSQLNSELATRTFKECARAFVGSSGTLDDAKKRSKLISASGVSLFDSEREIALAFASD